MSEKHSIEKIRRQAELLKSDKALNLDFILTLTSFYTIQQFQSGHTGHVDITEYKYGFRSKI